MLKCVLKSFIPSRLRRLIINQRVTRLHGLRLANDNKQYDILGSRFGRNCRLSGPLQIRNSLLGDYSYVEPHCMISDTTIGKFCSIAPNCVVGPLSHPIDRVSTHPAFYLRSDRYAYHFVEKSHDPSADMSTTIGNDVWLGASVFVKRGVTIGDGAIVGAGAVVVKDVPAYSIVGGIPAKILRQRFDAQTSARLQASKWWDRDDQWLTQHAELMSDLHAFLEKLESD